MPDQATITVYRAFAEHDIYNYTTGARRDMSWTCGKNFPCIRRDLEAVVGNLHLPADLTSARQEVVSSCTYSR